MELTEKASAIDTCVDNGAAAQVNSMGGEIASAAETFAVDGLEEQRPLKSANGRAIIDEAAEALMALLDEDAARAWVISRLHPSGARCPQCGLRLDDDLRFREGKRCDCGRCGRYFTARSGTFLQGSQLEYRQIVLLAALDKLRKMDITTQHICSLAGVSADTVRIWIKRFKALDQ